MVQVSFYLQLKQDQVHAKVMHDNLVEEEGKDHHDNGVTKLVPLVRSGHIVEGRNHNDNGVTKLVPHVVRPGHIRFEPLDGGMQPPNLYLYF